jgi:hypothetical protein
MKIRPVGAELFHADGRTDRWADILKLIVTFRDFVKVHNSQMTQCTGYCGMSIVVIRQGAELGCGCSCLIYGNIAFHFKLKFLWPGLL